MHSLVYSLRSLSEEKYRFVGGGTVRITASDLAAVLSESGSELQNGRIPDTLAPTLSRVGRVSGRLAERRGEPEPTHARVLKLAYAEARTLADGLDRNSGTDPVALSDGWVSAPKISAAYALLRENTSPSLPSPDTFRDILSDIAAERLRPQKRA